MRTKYINIFLLTSLIVFSIIFIPRAGSFLFAPRHILNNNANLIKTSPDSSENYQVIVENLDIPWEIIFLPDGDMLITERSGNLIKIGSEKKVIKKIDGVRHMGEGGLLGLALHPDFSDNGLLYLYFTTQSGEITNRVERYKLQNDELSEGKIILEGIKGSVNHDGGRIAFGPDGYLYITTGDAQEPDLAQDKNSLNGKILRISDEGEIPPDNPFGNAVYSLGHRNPQGLAWDDNKTLWETEHGPSGSQTGYDEINIIRKGENYGWPEVFGDDNKAGFTPPVIQSGSKDTWAPAGLTYLNGSLFFSGLRGESFYEAKINNNNTLELTTHFSMQFGRLRAAVLGPDGFLYISTSNKDGRGRLKDGDDKIIKINPNFLRG